MTTATTTSPTIFFLLSERHSSTSLVTCATVVVFVVVGVVSLSSCPLTPFWPFPSSPTVTTVVRSVCPFCRERERKRRRLKRSICCRICCSRSCRYIYSSFYFRLRVFFAFLGVAIFVKVRAQRRRPSLYFSSCVRGCRRSGAITGILIARPKWLCPSG